MSNVPANDPACAEARAAAVDLVIEGRPRDLGTITVSRILPAPKRRMVGPFIFLDHMGPVQILPGVGFDVPPHPHIGLSTVTYFLAGENVHRDNLGSVQVNKPLDINLMTAGRGVVHSERADPAFRASGGLMHGVQIWLALPEANEDDDASFEHHPASSLPAIAPAEGARGRVLIGSAFGVTSPVVHPSKPLLVDLELAAGACVTFAPGDERGVFVIDGVVEIGAETLGADRLAVLAAGEVTVRAVETARVMLIGGPPVGARLIDWNFVASTKERIERARAAWKAQAFAKIPGDDREFVPYPDLHR